MTTKALSRSSEMLPTFFEDFLRPWNDWFDSGGLMNRTLTVPSVNIIENKDDFNVSLAVPGMKKDDFKIDVSGNILTISCEKEEEKKEGDATYSREEYNYSSFSRSFTLPEDVDKEKIDARYENGELSISLPKKEEAKKLKVSKQITVK